MVLVIENWTDTDRLKELREFCAQFEDGEFEAEDDMDEFQLQSNSKAVLE